MASSLLTGVTGLLANNRFLEVIGNNIANANTTAFKSQRVVFSELLSETLRPATKGTDDTGGSNPRQVANGVAIAQMDRKFTQGALSDTGATFDLAVNGDGFFVISDGTQQFTRSGAFSLDADNRLVTSEGLRLQRFGNVGEAEGLQTPGDMSIQVPLGQSVPGVTTSEVSLTGNLSASTPFDQIEVLQSAAAFTVLGIPATGATLLNDLDSNLVDYVSGDNIRLAGTNFDGTPISIPAIPVDGTTTLQDLVDSINSSVSGYSASISTGNLQLTADSPGKSNIQLTIRDAPTNVAGATSFSDHDFEIVTAGGTAEPYPVSLTIYDSRGGAHELMLTFQRQSDDVWQMTAELDANDGVVTNGVIDNIVFNDQGQLITTGNSVLEMNIAGISTPMEVNVDFGLGSGETLTHYKVNSSVEKSQNGSEPGVLVVSEISADGTITGRATNGRTIAIAQLAIASFDNPRGLQGMGATSFRESLSSGVANIGLATSGARGAIQSGTLESSNVDMAFEFTRLIVAQRGYAANARTITISDEVLEELTNMIR